MQRTNSLAKTLTLGKIEAGGEGTTENKTVGWHHRLDGCEFQQTLGVGVRQKSLAAVVHGEESDTTEQLNNNEEGTSIISIFQEKLRYKEVKSLTQDLVRF